MGEVVLCLLDGVDGDSPLGIYPPFVLGDLGYSDWALLYVKDISWVGFFVVYFLCT
jgi:hypothetical protein